MIINISLIELLSKFACLFLGLNILFNLFKFYFFFLIFDLSLNYFILKWIYFLFKIFFIQFFLYIVFLKNFFFLILLFLLLQIDFFNSFHHFPQISRRICNWLLLWNNQITIYIFLLFSILLSNFQKPIFIPMCLNLLIFRFFFI